MKFSTNNGQRNPIFFRKSGAAGVGAYTRHFAVNTDDIAFAFFKLEIVPL